jgi:hypothetical protein
MTDIDYKKKCEDYEKTLGLGQHNPAIEAYKVLNKLMRDQTKYLNDIVLKELITAEDGAKKIEYQNAKGLWEGLPKMVTALEGLKVELKISEPKEQKEIERPISPQSIAAELKG